MPRRSATTALLLVVSWSAVAHAHEDFARSDEAEAVVDAELARAHARAPIDTRGAAKGYRWTAHDARRVGDSLAVAEVRLALLHETVPLLCTGFGCEAATVRVDLDAHSVVGVVDSKSLHELAVYMMTTFETARRVARAAISGAEPALASGALFRPSGTSDSWTLTFRRGGNEMSVWTARVEAPSGKLISLSREDVHRGGSSGL